jgi:hypothetical protein
MGPATPLTPLGRRTPVFLTVVSHWRYLARAGGRRGPRSIAAAPVRKACTKSRARHGVVYTIIDAPMQVNYHIDTR